MDNILDTDELLALAKLDIEARAFEAALKKLKLAVNSDDTPAEAYLMTARLYATLGLFLKSQQQYESYNSAEPQNTIGRFELGMTLFDSGDINGALEHWGMIIKDNRTHPPGLFYSALAYSRLGDMAKAKGHLDILMKSVSAENMYFQKGKELSLSIDMQLEKANTTTGSLPMMAYSEDDSSETLSAVISKDEVTH